MNMRLKVIQSHASKSIQQ